MGLHHGAEVHFQDYNPQVLHLLTMPNALANWCAWRATAGAAAGPPPPPPARFFSGSWASLEGLLARGGLAGGYDLVLTAETIYSPAAAAALLACVGACLRRPGGVALVAAKAYYFGCGGSLAGFLQAAEADGGFDVETLWTLDDGRSNARSIVQLVARARPPAAPAPGGRQAA